MKKQTEILNYIRQKCLSGEEMKSIKIAKEFKTHQRHLKSAEELGYIKKVAPFKYVWKVGEVIPVMSRAMSKKTTDYYNDKRGNKTVTTETDVSVTPVNDVEHEVQSVIQDCDFWERMYNELKARHEDVLKTNKELIEISGRDDKRINELRDENKALKIDLDFLKTLDDAGNTVIDNLKSEVNRLKETIRRRDSEIDRLICELDQQPKPKRKRWDFTLFGLPIFGTYEK